MDDFDSIDFISIVVCDYFMIYIVCIEYGYGYGYRYRYRYIINVM